jgi:hypothetical protein
MDNIKWVKNKIEINKFGKVFTKIGLIKTWVLSAAAVGSCIKGKEEGCLSTCTLFKFDSRKKTFFFYTTSCHRNKYTIKLNLKFTNSTWPNPLQPWRLVLPCHQRTHTSKKPSRSSKQYCVRYFKIKILSPIYFSFFWA